MKHIKEACIEQIIEFDTEDDLSKFIMDLEIKKKNYYVLYQRGTSLRIKIQYNNNTMLM